jgi:DNA helicase-2/ATP-dependent DNA helicase PcrA
MILETAKNPKLKRGRLILSTVHSAKGLEFEKVLLVDMVEGEFPSADAGESDSLMEEERRLCYVAITRARSDFRVFIPANWVREKKKPSRFVLEMENAMRDPPR